MKLFREFANVLRAYISLLPIAKFENSDICGMNFMQLVKMEYDVLLHNIVVRK